MEGKKSFWTTIIGGLASAAPILFSVCKGGACVGVCVSPVASLFGFSSATVAASPIVSAIEPLLIAISAVSFTVSYYSLYVLPKLNCGTSNGCDCEPNAKEKRKLKINKAVFWIGLILSIGFLSYFEITKYQAASMTSEASTECIPGGECTPGSCSDDSEAAAVTECDSTSSCCEKADTQIAERSTITCPKCGYEKSELMPTEVCQLSYTCEKCSTVMHPKDGDCCVFCTYGDHKCPSKQ